MYKVVGYTAPLRAALASRQTRETPQLTHARVGKPLWPRLGDEEAVNEVTFGGVKLGAADSSVDTAQQKTMSSMAGTHALGANHASECYHF